MKALTVAVQTTRHNVIGNNEVSNDVIPDSVIVSQEFGAKLLTDFFSFLDVSEKTRATYQRALRQLFRYFSEHGINRPSLEDMLNFKKSLESAGKKPSTIALYLAAARRFFSWTEQRGISAGKKQRRPKYTGMNTRCSQRKCNSRRLCGCIISGQERRQAEFLALLNE